jgi:hypothetical protein
MAVVQAHERGLVAARDAPDQGPVIEILLAGCLRRPRVGHVAMVDSSLVRVDPQGVTVTVPVIDEWIPHTYGKVPAFAKVIV